jgi:hypothetical protein
MSAQVPVPPQPVSAAQVESMLARGLEARRERLLSSIVRVQPTAVAVDVKTHMATLTVRNESNDTVTAALAAGLVPPPTVLDSTGAPSLGVVLVNDSTMLTHEMPLVANQSLVSWIKGLPKSVTLLPHESRTLTIHIVPPTGAAPGEYAAWVTATTNLRALVAPGGGGTPTLRAGSGATLGATSGRTTGAGRASSPGWAPKQLDQIAAQLQSGSKLTYRLP